MFVHRYSRLLARNTNSAYTFCLQSFFTDKLNDDDDKPDMGPSISTGSKSAMVFEVTQTLLYILWKVSECCHDFDVGSRTQEVSKHDLWYRQYYHSNHASASRENYIQAWGCCLRCSLTAKLLPKAVSRNCRPGLLIYVRSLHHVKWKLFLTNDICHPLQCRCDFIGSN